MPISFPSRSYRLTLIAVSLLCACLIRTGFSAQLLPADFLSEPSWSQPTDEQIRDELIDCLNEQSLDEFSIAIWDEAHTEGDSTDAPLERLVQVFAQFDPQVVSLATSCQSADLWLTVPDCSWLASESVHAFVSNNVRLYVAQRCVQYGFFDDAIELLAGIACSDVVAPDVLLFCRAVAHLNLVHPEEVELNAQRLLERESELPIRYQQLASLMLKDIEGLKDDSLDHVARRMSDIGRRLGKGRADERVQDIEKGVIESLDKMIEKLEEMQQQMASSSPTGGPPSGTPMDDSRLAEMNAPGKVDQRDIGNRSGWGDLPPKEREQAMQQIGRDFPSHYREVIQQYFRELANESAQPQQPK